MSFTVISTFSFIVVARIIDVSLDTVRTVSIIQGRRMFAAVLGFLEALVYICAVAQVLSNTKQPIYAVGYALGFAVGTYLGMVVEHRLAFGRQLVFLLSSKGPKLAELLRGENHLVAELKGHIAEGDLTIVCVETPRRQSQKVIRLATSFDERCAFLVHDLRSIDSLLGAQNEASAGPGVGA